MPWWSLIYLLILTLLSIAGIAEQFRTKQIAHGLATTISLAFLCSFVIAYYDPKIANSIGIWIIPMLIMVALYDWWLANLDLQPGSENFMQKLPDVKSNLNNMSAMLILLPAYGAGVMVAYHQLINA